MKEAAQVTIDALASGGAGVGRISGKACFVPYGAPGDLLRVRVRREKSSYAEATIEEILEASALRTVPPCPVFGRCGGCQWQHLQYEAQLEWKRRILAETLWRFGRVNPELVAPCLAAGEPYGYRTRIQLKLYHDGSKLHAGFLARGSHFVVDISRHCPISSPAVNAAIAEVVPFVAALAEAKSIPQIDIASGEGGRAAAVFHYIGSDIPGFVSAVGEALAELSSLESLLVQSGRKSTLALIHGEGKLRYGVPSARGDIGLSFSAGGFSQVNSAGNRLLVHEALQAAQVQAGERVLDLFCGNGNFSLPLAAAGAQVVGVEDFAGSVRDASDNAAAAGIGGTAFAVGDAAAWVRAAADRGETFDLVLLDPPRTGAADAVRDIPRLGARRIVYVSCDAATLGRDLASLAKSGYEAVRVQPIDMFPQTYHVESVVLLHKTPTSSRR